MLHKINVSDIKNITSEGCDANHWHAIVAQVCVMKSLFHVAVHSGGRQQSDHVNLLRRLGGGYANSDALCEHNMILSEMMD